MRAPLLSVLLLMTLVSTPCWAQQDTEGAKNSSGMVHIPGGSFVPLYGDRNQPVQVGPYDLDIYPVTNGDFLRFNSRNPRWQRQNIAALFADQDYLGHWKADLRLGDKSPLESPVTNVSWFAAKAYCAAQDKRLPTLDEWEFAARASADKPDAAGEADFGRLILTWYGKPTRLPLPEVGATFENYWGVWDMHGLVWEWVQDFNAVMITGASRKDAGGLDRQLFCAAGSIGAADPNDYAAFMRYAMRGSVEARYTVQNMGFRCARDTIGEMP